MNPKLKERLNFILPKVCADPKFQTGFCGEVAMALWTSLADVQLKVCSRTWEERGEEQQNNYSHVVACLENESFDAQGAQAEENWEKRWEESPIADETDINFDWTVTFAKEIAELKLQATGQPINRTVVAELTTKLRFLYKATEPQITQRIFFHGTNQAKFRPTFGTETHLGPHVGSLAAAVDRIYDTTIDRAETSGKLFALHLTVKKPLVLPDRHVWEDPKALGALIGLPDRTLPQIHQALLDQGYDAIAYENTLEGGDPDQWPFDRTSYIPLKPECLQVVDIPVSPVFQTAFFRQFVNPEIVFQKSLEAETNKLQWKEPNISLHQKAPPKKEVEMER